MNDNFGVAFVKKPLKNIQRSYIRWFGKSIGKEDKQFFDRRGAITVEHGQKSISDIGGGYTPADPMVLHRPSGGKFVSAQKAMDSNFGWVYTFVKAISDEISGIDFRLFKIKKNDGHEEVDDHELLDLLDGVNDFQTGPEFKKLLASHLEITGNAYLYLFGVKSFDDKPKAMYLLNPGQTQVFINKITFPFKVSHYVMFDDNREFRFEPYEIINIKYADPNDQFSGLGTVQGIAEWIDNDNYAMEFNRNFFRNGARMSGVFETDMTSIEQLQRLKIAFEEQFAGVKNAYKSMMMPKGVKWTPTQVTSKDMDFANLLNSTRDRILAGSRVSKTILGTAESDTNRGTAETADYVFAKRTIKPKMIQIISYLNEFLAPRFGDDIYISFDDPVPEDKAARIEEMKIAVAGKQTMTQNEAREGYLGLGALPDKGADEINGDVSAAGGSDNVMSDKSSKKRLAVPVFVKYSKVGKRRAVKTQFSRNMKVRQEVSKGLAQKMAEFILQAKKKNLAEMTDDEYLATIYVHSKKLIDEYEIKFKQTMALISARQKEEVLKNFENAIKGMFQKSIDKSKLFDLKEWIGITIAEISPVATEFFTREFKAAATNVGSPEVQISNTIKDALMHRMELLSRSYNETIIDTLAAKLDEGLSQGFSRAELANSVQDIYAWSETVQAERVAKTETVAISNMANKSAWQADGNVLTVKWYTSLKDNVCPLCRAMAGTEIDINDNFLNLGDEFTGDDGKSITVSYSDIVAPPLHPNCGCLIRPASLRPIS